VSLTLLAGLPERSRDLDNIIKATCDLLQANGVIENDAGICEVFAKWDKTVPSGRCRIEVRQALAPELRMGLEARRRLSIQKRGLWDGQR
jgi:Holliday junction resolvase RusA-like endonuclease